ncbi:MAG: chalcone isomerase family protein [Desulfomonilia bacterium]|jgi:hypothetical protein
MVLRRVSITLLTVLFFATSAFALELAGVNMPDTIKAGGNDLVLNGAGIRTKFFIKAYVGGLYLKQKSSDAEKIMDADEPMAVKLVMTSGLVTSDKMESAVREGFENSTKGNIAPIKDKIEAFINVFKAKLAKGDVFEFVNVPGKGVEIYKNGSLASTIQGLDFKKALFGIWLCDKPAQADLKNKMLGK